MGGEERRAKSVARAPYTNTFRMNQKWQLSHVWSAFCLTRAHDVLFSKRCSRIIILYIFLKKNSQQSKEIEKRERTFRTISAYSRTLFGSVLAYLVNQMLSNRSIGNCKNGRVSWRTFFLFLFFWGGEVISVQRLRARGFIVKKSQKRACGHATR